VTTTGPANVRIYTTTYCAYCHAAKRLLGARGVPYEEIDVTGDDATRRWLRETTDRLTVPQIFIGDRAIGGYTELAALDRSGALRNMLSSGPPSASRPGQGVDEAGNVGARDGAERDA
jgi:glutaredoxin 3